MSEYDKYLKDPRGYGLDIAEQGGFALAMLRDALNWMSKDECADFLHSNGYAPENDDDEIDDDDEIGD